MISLIDAPVQMVASPESFAPLLVANGVTCVRDTITVRLEGLAE